MICLSKEQILSLHQSLIKEFGGELGIRDEKLLDLSLNSPFHTFNGKDLYQGNLKKIVHLSFSLIKNHPFIDGNKRIATHVLLILLEINGYSIKYKEKELIDIIISVASSSKTETDLLTWVRDHIL